MKIYFLALLLIPNLLMAESCMKVPHYVYDEEYGKERENKICNRDRKCIEDYNNDRNFFVCSEECKDSLYFNNYDGFSEILKYDNKSESIYYNYCNGNLFEDGDFKLICDNFKLKYENPYNKESIKNIKKYCSQFDKISNNYINYRDGIIKVSNKVFVLNDDEYKYLIDKFNDANRKYEDSLKEPIKISFINIMQYISLGLSGFIIILILFLFRNLKKIKKQK